MQKNKKIKRIFCFFMALMLLSGIFTSMPQVEAAEITKTEKTYEIAVVFDNSGSMYMDGNKAWCRAKYAMEIFASMLNYENGDKLKIFPMWEVTRDGTKNSYAPIDITSSKDIDKITNMYTENPNNTPFEPIKEAHEYLKTSAASEKWLIVLTDGIFNMETRTQSNTQNITASELRQKLIALASSEIKVQYLGFGKATELQSSAAKYFYAKKSTDTSLKDDLVGICNSIFERSVLPSDRLSGKTLKLDLSMKNLIVFAQGKGAKITSLVNEDGDEVGITLDSGQRTYSTISAKFYEKEAGVDNTLAGQVVTFDACKAGTYALNYSGADKIQIFYEPDVDISITLTNQDGQVVDTSEKEIASGEYTLDYTIIDNVTGKDVMDSELLGTGTELSATVKDSKGNETPVKSGDKITLEPDDATYFHISGNYLKDYTISTDSNQEGYTFEVTPPAEDALTVKADVTQSNNWYKIKDHEEWDPVKVTLALNGEPVSDEVLSAIQWDIKTSKPLEFWYEVLPGESACNIYIGHTQDGEFAEPETGRYKMEVHASFVDEYEREIKGDDTVSFEIQTYSAVWRWLIYLLILAVIALIVLYFMSRKVLPKGMVADDIRFAVMGQPMINGGEMSYVASAKSLEIDSIPTPAIPEAECHISFVVEPVDRRWTPSKRRRVCIVGVDATSQHVTRIKADSTIFQRTPDGEWEVKGAPGEPIHEIVRDATFTAETNYSTLRCTTTHL